MAASEFPLWMRRILALAALIGGSVGAYAWADGKIEAKIEDKVSDLAYRLDRIENKLDALLLRSK